jgi:ATP-dependent helicase/nuclease subunit B
MPVQFILGRAGSGKTSLLRQLAIDACRADPLGDPILWLVPKQATFQAQRDLCCGSGLDGYFRIQVVPFDLLSQQILAEVGGSFIPQITRFGRQMILGHLLRQLHDKLSFFSSVASQSGLAAELDQTFEDLDSSGSDLTGWAGQIEKQFNVPTGPIAANTALADKIRDLELLHHRYQIFLGQDRLDPARRLQQALDAMQNSAFLRRATVLVDQFFDFTHRERRMLTILGRVCPAVHIALTMDCKSNVLANPHNLPDDDSIFHRTERTYRKLHFALAEAGVPIAAPILLTDSKRFTRPALQQIERGIPGAPADSPTGLELIEAPNRRAEVDAAARRVRDLVATGVRYRDIGILTRSLKEYDELIAATFAEHSIPYFADQRRTASHHALVQFLRAVVAAAQSDWPSDEMLSILKSGLCGLTAPEADQLENYLLLHAVHGRTWTTPEPWHGHDPSDTAADELRRRLVEKLQPFFQSVTAQNQTARSICKSVFDLLESCNIRPTISQWIADAQSAGRHEEAGEHQQIWTELLKLFNELVDVLQDQSMTLADFAAVLDAGLNNFDLALPPQTVDQVLVGDVDRIRPPALKAVILLGLSEGQFPSPVETECIFTDADHRTLARINADVGPDPQRRALDEYWLAYFAFTRPSELLVVTRCIADESGKALQPSLLWQQLRSFVPSAVVESVSTDDATAANISTPRQLLTGLMQWARRADDDLSDSFWPPLYQWLATRPKSNDAVDQLCHRAWPALSYTNQARLSPHLAAQIFSSPLKTTARQLETFAACPFQHFVRFGLKLSSRRELEITGRDISSACRDALNKLLSRLLEQNQSWRDLDPAQIQNIVRELTAKLADEFPEADPARRQYQVDCIERTLNEVVAAQRAASLRGKFESKRSQVRFGEGGKLPALRIQTPAGQEVHIDGAIDRIDVGPDKQLLAIVYRLKAEPLRLDEVYWGLSLELATDLLALQSAPGCRPAAALVVPALRKMTDSDDPENSPSPSDEAFVLRAKPRGIFDAAAVSLLDSNLTEGKSDVVQVFIKKDRTIGNLPSSDAASADELAALLEHVRQKIGTLADEILAGSVSVRPYRLKNDSPCPSCSVRDVCRFESAQGFAQRSSFTRLQVFELVKEQSQGPDQK